MVPSDEDRGVADEDEGRGVTDEGSGATDDEAGTGEDTDDVESGTADEAGTDGTPDGDAGRRRCDFCRLPCPTEPVELDHDGSTYRFCSVACRDAMASSDRVFTEYHGHRQFHTGVDALDAALPQGIPRNSFVMLTGEAGARQDALQAELVWRTLQRGESAVVVTFREPPMSVVEVFVSLDWNVLPYLENGQLHVLDCFSYRLPDSARSVERMSRWNRHVHGIADDATTRVRDPSDLRELENKLENCLDDRGMVDSGLVVIDSLTELATHVQPVQAYDFVKNVRASVCKARFVPIVAGATFGGNGDAFPHDLDYITDGVVDLQLTGDVVEDTLIKRLRVRKMSGVLAISRWRAYEYTSERGLVAFDPEAEMREAEAEREAADAPATDDDGDAGETAPDEDAADSTEATPENDTGDADAGTPTGGDDVASADGTDRSDADDG